MMKLTLSTTEDALIYQWENEHPVTMYGAAASCGVQFNDTMNTAFRAFKTIYFGINCISVNQDGRGHRDFYVAPGTQVIVESWTSVRPCT